MLLLQDAICSTGKVIKMVYKLCNLYANTLVEVGIISEDDREIHEYGMTALLINMINYGVWLLLAVISSTIIETFFFLLSYSLLRNLIGGWHASTPLRCSICGVVMWACMMLLYKTVALTVLSQVFGTVFLVLCLVYIIQKQDVSSSRKQAGVFCLLVLFISAIFFMCSNKPYSILISLSFFFNVLMNIPCLITQ